MSLATTFHSFGHAIAAGAKYFSIGAREVLGVAAHAQVLQPEVDALMTAIAGPQAAKAADLGFYALGQVAAALKPLDDHQTAAIAANGLNIALDTATVSDVKNLIAVIEALLKARGTPAPAVTPGV